MCWYVSKPFWRNVFVKLVLVYNIYEMYVCTEKTAIQEWLKEIEELKAENKRFEESLTKWKDKRIEVLIKENRELRKENKELKNKLNLLTNQK